MTVPLLALVAALALWAAYAVRRRYFPAPVPWSWEDEEEAEFVAAAFHVTLEEARLAVLAWRVE